MIRIIIKNRQKIKISRYKNIFINQMRKLQRNNIKLCVGSFEIET